MRISTVGSIVGTFLSAIVTIPLIGTQRTMLGSAVILVLAAALLLGSRWHLLTVFVAGLLFVPAGEIKASPGLLFETESAYQYIQIVERSDGSRALKLNEGVAVHSVWHRDSVLTGGVWDTFLLVPPLLDRPVERMLVIGNAGGTIARAYGELYPGVEIDGVEIDPEVSEAARRYMGLGDNPRLDVITADGRPYLELTDNRYDIVVVDAYHQPYIPFYLATREFFEAVGEHLRPGGVIALNVASVPDDERLSAGRRQHSPGRVPAGLALEAAALQRAHARLRPAGEPGGAGLARGGRAGRDRRLGAPVPLGARAGAADGAPVHRRPRAGRVGHRPDDRRLHRRGRLPRRGVPAYPARLSLCRGDGQRAEDRPRGDELCPGGHAALAMPAAEAVAREELAPARARKREHVLDVGDGRGDPSHDGRVERPARGGEQEQGGGARGDLEAPGGDVAVRHTVAGRVQEEAEPERAEARPCERAAGRARGDVERDDHRRRGARCEDGEPGAHGCEGFSPVRRLRCR